MLSCGGNQFSLVAEEDEGDAKEGGGTREASGPSGSPVCCPLPAWPSVLARLEFEKDALRREAGRRALLAGFLGGLRVGCSGGACCNVAPGRGAREGSDRRRSARRESV